MSIKHYENFPVASWLFPRDLAPTVLALYQFARNADDIADEGDIDRQTRLDALQACGEDFGALTPFITLHNLDTQHLHDLLSAFKQDVWFDVERLYYDEMSELLDYCMRSANPVGRLMLQLFKVNDAEAVAASDEICTALQLINFWQDIAIDADKIRVYVPEDTLEEYGYTPESILYALPETVLQEKYRQMMRALCNDVENRMLAGKTLLPYLRGRFKLEIACTIAGGLRILSKLRSVDYDVLNHRPVLNAWDRCMLVLHGIRLCVAPH